MRFSTVANPKDFLMLGAFVYFHDNATLYQTDGTTTTTVASVTMTSTPAVVNGAIDLRI